MTTTEPVMAVPPTNGDVANRQAAQERAVGINVFVRPDAPVFKCILKQRYTDFLVNEILPNGSVLHLTEITDDKERKRKRNDNHEDAARKKSRPEDQGQSAGGADISAEDGETAQQVAPRALAVPDQNGESAHASVQAAKESAIASISDDDKAILNALFGEQTTAAIIELYASVTAYPTRKPREHAAIQSEPFAEKAKRTEAHLCIRRIFNSKLETVTVQDQHQSGSGSFISIKASLPKPASNPNGSNPGAVGQRGKQNWSELGGEYLHFTLYKENKDTMEVLYFLASQLKMHIKHFSFAGTKDRRGVTVQRVAIHRVKRERIEHLNRLARGWRIGGPWEYCRDALDLGMLSGNEFLLTLRDASFDGQQVEWDMQRKLEHAQSVVTTAARSMNESGFLNFYGLQRFGTYITGTHAVGMNMLRGELKEAVDGILSYDPALLKNVTAEDGEQKKVPHDDIARAVGIHAFVTTGSSKDALLKIPSRFSAERALVTHLGKRDGQNGSDFQGALGSIQRNLRLMYVHAYQSFVWNTVAGRRWQLHGDTVVEGDLVVIGEKDRGKETSQDSEAPGQQVDQDGDPIIHPTAEGGGATSGMPDDPFTRARPLTKAEAESGRYSVFDLVLPLPGYDVLYPNNELGKFYEEFMASSEGGGLDPHNMRRTWKDVSLSGGYRKMMARPLGRGVEVDVKAYDAAEEQMVETDLERLEKTKQVAPIASEQADGHEKTKTAVVLKLQLGSSQYATMALRELTHGGSMAFRPDFSAANR